MKKFNLNLNLNFALVVALVVVINKLKSFTSIGGPNGPFINLNTGEVISDNLNPQDIISNLDIIRSSTIGKGYVNNHNLMEYDIIKVLVPKFILKVDSDLEKEAQWDLLKGSRSHVVYYWIYNLVILSYYYLTVKFIAVNNDNDSDELTDMNSLSKELFSKLDPSIRSSLQRKGVTITENIYTGFDTEYVHVANSKVNNLLSTQLAVNNDLVIKLPLNKDYTFSSINAQTGEKYNLTMNTNLFNFNLLEILISRIIKSVRLIKFSKSDSEIDLYTNKLKTVTSLEYFETNEHIVFKSSRSYLELKVNYLNEYSLEKLISDSNELSIPILKARYNSLVKFMKDELITEGSVTPHDDDISIPDNSIKFKIIKTKIGNSRKDYINITRIRNNYIITHFSPADLTMLSDFNLFKDKLSIIDKSFVTLGKPIQYAGSNVIIRDTKLLAPQGKKDLKSLGILHNIPKIELTQNQIENMDVLLKEDKDLFEKYAINDAVITLKHANFMEDELFVYNEIGIPVTLSSLAERYVLYKWKEINYKGYQIHKNILIGDVSNLVTPKTINIIDAKDVVLNLNYFIASYRGGRNESFMYGIDNDTLWYDYDLVSAYTTVMFRMGNPMYNNAKIITFKELNKLEDKEIIYNFIVLLTDFEFPKDTMYPSIPCSVDESTTIYPISGSNVVITGIEYILARNQGAVFSNVKIIIFIPSEYNIDKESKTKYLINHPFKSIIEVLQDNRRKYPKGTIENLLEKLKGNAIYGLVSRGINSKKRFDIKTGKTVKMEAGKLSNPIFASWITAFIRSVIGELLHNIYLLKGKVVSVTTDGFITDIKELESVILSNKSLDTTLLSEFKSIRNDILNSTDANALEVKFKDKGIITWCTRGQLSHNIKATTGFQARGYKNDELKTFFTSILKSDNKEFNYIYSTLTSPNTIYKSKVKMNVTIYYSDHVFRLLFDNKRFIIDSNNSFHSSKPWFNVNQAMNSRRIANIIKNNEYQKLTHVKSNKEYKNYTELAIRNFIRALFNNDFNINNPFNSYNDIIEFIKTFDKKINLQKYTISRIKNNDKFIYNNVPLNKDTFKFATFVKTKFPLFDFNKFFKDK